MNSTFNIYKTYILIGGLMKNIFNYFFLISLVFFSFFYTDKVINIINKKDPLMVEITKQKDKYKVEPTEAIITENTVIPGRSAPNCLNISSNLGIINISKNVNTAIATTRTTLG